MFALIPLIRNDYWLTIAYAVVITVAFGIKSMHNEGTIFLFRLVIMAVYEYLFIATGVETFRRHTLFGIMPLWLPFLWAYGFVAIKRTVLIIHG